MLGLLHVIFHPYTSHARNTQKLLYFCVVNQNVDPYIVKNIVTSIIIKYGFHCIYSVPLYFSEIGRYCLILVGIYCKCTGMLTFNNVHSP